MIHVVINSKMGQTPERALPLRVVGAAAAVRIITAVVLVYLLAPESVNYEMLSTLAALLLPAIAAELLYAKRINIYIIYVVVLGLFYVVFNVMYGTRFANFIAMAFALPNIITLAVVNRRKKEIKAGLSVFFFAALVSVLFYGGYSFFSSFFESAWRGDFDIFGALELLWYDFRLFLGLVGLSNSLGFSYLMYSQTSLNQATVDEIAKKESAKKKLLHDIRLGEGNVKTLAGRYRMPEADVSDFIQSAVDEGSIEGTLREGAEPVLMTESYIKEYIRRRLLSDSGASIKREDDEDLPPPPKPSFEEAWARILSNTGQVFHTKSGYPFTYAVEDNVLSTSRTSYTLSRDQFEAAYQLVPVKGPGLLNKIVRGPSYVWALLHDKRILNG